jgi:CheY-like chemotaxis protein
VRVLVVEDNPIDQLVVLSALRRVGYAPEAVTTGEEALEACARQPFDILFLDLGMSGIDGFEAAARIRAAEPAGQRTPIIALTGRVRDGERERWLEAGMDDFLPKPIDLELMCATVEKWVNRSEPAAPAVAPAAAEAPIAPANDPPSPLAPPMESDVAWVDANPASWPEAVAPADIPEIHAAGGDWQDVALLDPARIETSSMGNPELRSMLVDAFLARTQQPLARLRLAYQAGDAVQVEIQAHALHGLCSTVGATRAAALFERIASAATPESLAGIDDLVARSASEVRLAMEAIEPRAEAA